MTLKSSLYTWLKCKEGARKKRAREKETERVGESEVKREREREAGESNKAIESGRTS